MPGVGRLPLKKLLPFVELLIECARLHGILELTARVANSQIAKGEWNFTMKKSTFKYFNVIVLILCLIAVVTNTFAQSGMPHYAKADSRWQWDASSDGTTYIPICWENPEGYSTETSWVRDAIANSWESVANITLQGWGKCHSFSGGVRILIADTRSHTKAIGKGLDGLRNGMELNFTFRNLIPSCQAANKKELCIKSLAIHEFGHALGFLDEDTDGRGNPDCNDSGGTSGWRLSSSDRQSVMNYCNPRWNGGGELSSIDIKDIQTLYGAKVAQSQGLFSISDSLDSSRGQIWENVVMDFTNSSGGSRQFFVVDNSAKTQVRSWNVPSSGQYCYRVWTYTIHTNWSAISGFGEGCVTLEKGGKYLFNLVHTGVHPGGYLNLKIQNASNASQVY